MRNKILIVDDEEINREILRQLFEKTYEIITAENGDEALRVFYENRENIAAVLLDLVMPQKDGYQVLLELYSSKDTQVIPVILITVNTDIGVAQSCYSIGAAEIINKPFVAGIVKQRVTNMIEMFSSRESLKERLSVSERELFAREKQLEEFNDKFVDTISNIVEFRDMESGQHVRRVKGLTEILAKCYKRLYPECGLDDHLIGVIVKSAALHDIGKIVIPDSILLKPARLTEEEMEVMRSHTTRGCEILHKLINVQDEEQYRVSYEIVRHHHERYDGNGYPDKLKGDEIPLSAGLVSVADVYDALTSKRVYKKAFDKETAYNMIINGECGVFSPMLIACLKESKSEIEAFVELVSEKEDD